MSLRFQKAYKYLCFAVLFLIALGGSVRAMNAGLACPDWPLCFGDLIPDYHPQVYFEFIHRVVAGLLALAILVMNIRVLRWPRVSRSVKILVFASFSILLIQIVMGGLTVLWQLHAKVVTAHLGLGTGLFACLLWIYFSISKDKETKPELKGPRWLKTFSLVVVGVVFFQIMLGGLVASHYAALVCTDFPLCHGQLIPTFKGIIGLQVIHRLGAYTTFFTILVFAIAILRSSMVGQAYKRWAIRIGFIITMQVVVGIANVLLLTPPIVTVFHLALGVSLFGMTLRVFFLSQNFAGEEASNFKIKEPFQRPEVSPS